MIDRPETDDVNSELRIVLDGSGRHYETLNSSGLFEMNGVLPGSYQLSIMADTHLVSRLPRPIRMTAGACRYEGTIKVPIP